MERGYTNDLVQQIEQIFLNIVQEDEPEIADFVRELVAVQEMTSRKRRMDLYDVLDQKLTQMYEDPSKTMRTRLKTHEIIAKMADLSRTVRKIAASHILEYHASNGDYTSDRYECVFADFASLSPDNVRTVKEARVQTLVQENARVCFSVTAHPTNPTTVEFVRAAIEVDKILSSNNATQNQLEDALRDYAKVPLVGSKKSIEEEVYETLAVFDQVYDALPEIHAELEDNLKKYKYDRVNIPKKMVYFSMWAAGDGDGNENATQESLRHAISINRNHINTRYLFDLQQIRDGLKAQGGAIDSIQIVDNIIDYISVNNQKNINYNTKYIISQIQELSLLLIDDEMKQLMADFMIRMYSFGAIGPHIDIRHNAEDIMITLAVLLENVGVIGEGRFFASAEEFLLDATRADDEPRKGLISACFNDVNISKEAGYFTRGTLFSENEQWKEIANRVFGRLREVAKNEGVSDKLIIAEAQSATHGLAALLLLQLAGVDIVHHPKMDIVPLFESRDDLEQAASIIQEMMSVEIFRKYTQKRGVIKPMIAKSDTQRRSGSGIKWIQERTIAELHKLQKKYDLPVSIFHGGGIELQRGGGRVTELSRITAEALLGIGIDHMGVPDTTIQGHQGRLFFASTEGVKNFVGFSIAQQLYNSALLAGDVKPVNMPKKRPHIENAERDFFACAISSYEKKWFKNQDIIDLAQHVFPWLAVKVSNVSSRSSMRGAKQADNQKQTFATLMGFVEGDDAYNHKLIDPFGQRAITFDRLMAHSGTSLSFILGLEEAFDLIKDQHINYVETLHAVYEGSKVFRDLVRNTAIILKIMDFDHAWSLLGWHRPSYDELLKMTSDKQNSPTDVNHMAEIEMMAHKVENFIYLTLNKEVATGNILGDALASTWPELSAQMESRSRQVEFSKMQLAKITRYINHHRDELLTGEKVELLRLCYVAEDIGFNTPSGVGLTQTDKRRGLPTMFSEKGVEHLIEKPKLLASFRLSDQGS